MTGNEDHFSLYQQCRTTGGAVSHSYRYCPKPQPSHFGGAPAPGAPPPMMLFATVLVIFLLGGQNFDANCAIAVLKKLTLGIFKINKCTNARKWAFWNI